MMDHNEAEWKWTVTLAPEFIDNPNKRNPKVVLGKVGSYDILFEVIKMVNVISVFTLKW